MPRNFTGESWRSHTAEMRPNIVLPRPTAPKPCPLSGARPRPQLSAALLFALVLGSACDDDVEPGVDTGDGHDTGSSDDESQSDPSSSPSTTPSDEGSAENSANDGSDEGDDEGETPTPSGGETGDTPDSDSDSDSEGDSASDTTGDDGGTQTSDCDALPALPAPYKALPGFVGSEDFVFDNEGYMRNVGWYDKALFRSAYGGSPELLIPDVSSDVRGISFELGGEMLMAEMRMGVLKRVTEDGSETPLASDLDGPNGIMLTPDGQIYVSATFGQKVWLIDPESGQKTVVAEFPEMLDGLTFSPDYSRLYVNTFEDVGQTGGKSYVYEVEIKADGTGGPPQLLTEFSGWPDGMAVDVCGNVYVANHYDPPLRITPDGDYEVLVELDSVDGKHPFNTSLHFGSGKGGWDSSKIYLMGPANAMDGDGPANFFEIDVGVEGRPEAHLGR